MVDVHDKATRSRNMSAIKGKNTKPELWLRQRLHALGFRYRLDAKDLPSRPDIVLPKYQAVILVHGCFWHMHDCYVFRLPKSRTEWWREKLSSNRARDKRDIAALREAGWRVLVVWECAIKGRAKQDEAALIDCVTEWLRSEEGYLELQNAQDSWPLKTPA